MFRKVCVRVFEQSILFGKLNIIDDQIYSFDAGALKIGEASGRNFLSI